MPTAPKKAVSRPARRTKAEVEQEFRHVQQQVEAAREQSLPREAELIKLRDAEVRQAVDGLTLDTVVQRISTLSWT